MTKTRLDLEPDEWLIADLEAFENLHPELVFKKDVLQNYVSSLKEKVRDLEAQVRYLNDMAENAEGLARASSQHQDSPQGDEKALPTQEPQVLAPSSDLHIMKIGNKTYRISDTQIAKTVWKDGETIFSRKYAEHLAFLESAAQIAAQVQRNRTEEHQKRAEATVDMHRQIAIYHRKPHGIIPEPDQPYLLSACPLGRTSSHCIANPCDKRPDCEKEHRINHGALKYDHGEPTEGYVT